MIAMTGQAGRQLEAQGARLITNRDSKVFVRFLQCFAIIVRRAQEKVSGNFERDLSLRRSFDENVERSILQYFYQCLPGSKFHNIRDCKSNYCSINYSIIDQESGFDWS